MKERWRATAGRPSQPASLLALVALSSRRPIRGSKQVVALAQTLSRGSQRRFPSFRQASSRCFSFEPALAADNALCPVESADNNQQRLLLPWYTGCRNAVNSLLPPVSSASASFAMTGPTCFSILIFALFCLVARPRPASASPRPDPAPNNPPPPQRMPWLSYALYMSSISAAAARSTTTAPAATKASSQPAATATSGMTRLPFASRKSATASSTATSTSIHWYLAPPSTTSASSTASRSSLVPTSKTYGGKLGVSALRARNNQPWTTLWSGTYDMPFIPASIRLGEWLWNPRARCDLNNPYDDPRNSSAAAVARSIRLLSMVQNWVSMDFVRQRGLMQTKSS